MSKLSLKVLFGVFALMFSANVSQSFPIECTNVNSTPLHRTFVSAKAAKSWLPKKIILKKSSIDYFGVRKNKASVENNWTFFFSKKQIKAKYIPVDKKLKVHLSSMGGIKIHAPVYYTKCVDKSRSVRNTASATTTYKASNQNKLKSTFMKKTYTDRRNIQSALSELGLYSSTIDGLFGKGTEAALKAYNKKYLGNPDLRKLTNALALLKDILKDQPDVSDSVETSGSLKKPAATCDDDPNECTPKKLCEVATQVINDNKVWSEDARAAKHIAFVKKLGMECGVVEITDPCDLDPKECKVKQLCEKATTGDDGSKSWNAEALAYVKLAKEYGLGCGM